MIRTPSRCIAGVLLSILFFLCGCDSANRKHFTRLEATKGSDDSQYFLYSASTGARGLGCAPGSKVCKVKQVNRMPLWPLDDAQAEQKRILWLEQWLEASGFEGSDYEILSRELLFGGEYDIRYAVKVNVM
ncbi:MAG: hypothetical protein FVQ80_05495 [Planctomycetes bacterium]|nr:hypothetical protein [Planctomycetota bacterium]